MDFMVFQAGKNDDGRRIDRILKTILPASPLSAVYKSLRKGLIKVNGRKVDAAFKVALGDEITVAQFLLTAKSGAESEVARESGRVKKNIPTGMVVFRNEHLLILDKPYDVPVQPSADRTLVSLSALVQDDFLAQEKDASLAFRPGPLHRLDRKTTGLVAFSQSIDGARIFSGWIKNHALEKIYLGLVLGRMEQEESWVDKIEKNDGGVGAFHTVRIVEGAEPGGKSADTYAVPLSHGTLRGHDVTLCERSDKLGGFLKFTDYDDLKSIF